MILQISASIAAIAFAVLVYYLIQTLKTANQSLERASATLERVQHTIESLNEDLQATARHANEVTATVHKQVQKLEPVVDSVQYVGEALSEVTLAAKQMSVGFVNGLRRSADPDATGTTAHHTEPSPTTCAAPAQPLSENQVRPPAWYAWMDLGAQAWGLYRTTKR